MSKGGIPGWLKWVVDQVVAVVVKPGKPKKLKWFVLSLEDGQMQHVMRLSDPPVTLRLEGVDAAGNLVTWTGVPNWTNSDAVVGSLVPAADGRSAVFTPLALGGAQVAAAMGSIRSKEPVDFSVEAGVLAAFILTVEPNV